jgi:peptidoglycan hydrolase-like protein with peptidoglycan-binding domain
MHIVISAGHALKVRGAAGPAPWGLDEVDEVRKMTTRTAELLRARGHTATTYWDDISTTQSENLQRIVDFHNARSRDIDCSIHMNAFEVTTTKPMGVECCFKTQKELAAKISKAMAAAAQLPDRGPKERTDLKFLNATSAPAVLVEAGFCDAKIDCDAVRARFDAICDALASALADEELDVPAAPVEAEEPGDRALKKGSQGPDVAFLQESLGIPADGDFGEITATQVKAFQAATGLPPDGVVGGATWDEVFDLNERVDESTYALTEKHIAEVIAIAEDSALMDYPWNDRGVTPPGYLPGMCLCYANLLVAQPDCIDVMSMADAGKTDIDALAWYHDEFKALGMKNDVAGTNTLRHLFVLMIGLGVRESSGKCYEGRDLSASNVESDTCEAGLFQTSWNIRSAHGDIPLLLDEFWEEPCGFEQFRKDLWPTANNLSCYGTGDGARYQWLARFAPLFTVMVTAIGLRTRRQHWGPVNRKEIEILKTTDALLKQIESIQAIA